MHCVTLWRSRARLNLLPSVVRDPERAVAGVVGRQLPCEVEGAWLGLGLGLGLGVRVRLQGSGEVEGAWLGLGLGLELGLELWPGLAGVRAIGLGLGIGLG